MIDFKMHELDRTSEDLKKEQEMKMSETGSRGWLEVGIAIAGIMVVGIGALLLLASPAYAGADIDCGEEFYYECGEIGSVCTDLEFQGNAATFYCDNGVDIERDYTDNCAS